ncbi:hypothetical protein ACVWW5_007022 [Bradyrhizobium sp. LM3.4]
MKLTRRQTLGTAPPSVHRSTITLPYAGLAAGVLGICADLTLQSHAYNTAHALSPALIANRFTP